MAGEAAQRANVYRRRTFVSLVNSARLDDADRMADVVAQVGARAALPAAELADDELDVLFCGAMLELQRPKPAAERALNLLRQLRGACTSAAHRAGSAELLLVPARNAEILALNLLGRKQEADALRLAVRPGRDRQTE
jgi:hypothetical protein